MQKVELISMSETMTLFSMAMIVSLLIASVALVLMSVISKSVRSMRDKSRASLFTVVLMVNTLVIFLAAVGFSVNSTKSELSERFVSGGYKVYINGVEVDIENVFMPDLLSNFSVVEDKDSKILYVTSKSK